MPIIRWHQFIRESGKCTYACNDDRRPCYHTIELAAYHHCAQLSLCYVFLSLRRNTPPQVHDVTNPQRRDQKINNRILDYDHFTLPDVQEFLEIARLAFREESFRP